MCKPVEFWAVYTVFVSVDSPEFCMSTIYMFFGYKIRLWFFLICKVKWWYWMVTVNPCKSNSPSLKFNAAFHLKQQQQQKE